MPQQTTSKDATRFFLPLILMTEMNMISKSVIHAFLARLAAPKIALAAFSTAFAFYTTISSPMEISTVLAISHLRDRRSIVHLLGFYCVLLALPVAVALLVAFTALGDLVFGGLFGASAEVIHQARLATLIFEEARILIDVHKEKGHEVVMMTSATRYQAEPVAHDLGIDNMCCTELEIVAGRLTGIAETCYGESKRIAADRYAFDRQVALDNAHRRAEMDALEREAGLRELDHEERTIRRKLEAVERDLKELERENAELKKMVAEQALDMEILKEAAKGNW